MKLLLFDIHLNVTVWVRLLPVPSIPLECCIWIQYDTPSFAQVILRTAYEIVSPFYR